MKEKIQLSKWIDGQLSDDEEKNIPDLDVYQKIRDYSADLQAPQLNKDRVKQKINSVKKSSTTSSFYLKIAATLLFFLGVGSALFYLGQVSISAKNSISYVNLPDHSKVHLQENTQLSYNRFFWFLNREVELNGNAYFEVEKGEKFTVHTLHGKVAVLGTKFTVATNEDFFNVKCFEGKVAVHFNSEKQILLPNKSVEIDIEKKQVELSEFNYNQPIWAFNEVKFSAIPFEKLITILSENFSLKIDYSNLQNPPAFTGTLQLDNLKETLEVFASTYSIRIQQINKNNYIFVEDEME